MKILCVLNKLIIPGVGHRKEDAYAPIVKGHYQNISRDTHVLAVGSWMLKREQIDKARVLIGNAPVIDVRGFSIVSVLGYLWAVRQLIFFTFIKQYRRELSAVDRYIRSQGCPDVISAIESVENSGILSFLIHKRYGVPYIIFEERSHYERGFMVGKRGKIARTVVSAAKAIVADSPHLEKQISMALKIELPHSTSIAHPVPDKYFEKPQEIIGTVENFAQGRFIFAGWTRWRDIKRLDVALDAFKIVHSKHPRSCFVVAGQVPDWAEKRVDDLGLTKAVFFAGHVNREGIHYIAHKCDCCVLSSDYETFGLPVIEAMAAGKPVVSTKSGGPDSILINEKLGFLVEKGQPEELAAAMLKVLEQYSEFNHSFIRSYCMEHYSERAISSKWQALYEDLFNV